MKSNYKIMFLVFLLLVVAGVFVFIYVGYQKKETVLKVDQIEDIKGLGYSGQRKIVQDSKGNYFVAYRKKYQGKSEIFVVKIFFQKGNWQISGTEKPVALVSGADQRVPSININLEDDVYVVWYGSDSNSKKQENNRQIKFVKSSDSGSSWSDVKNVAYIDDYESREEYWQEHPYILAGKNKELFVVWEGKDKDNSNQQIKFSRSLNGGETWSEWRNVFQSTENTQSRPTLVLDASGKLHLFFYSSLANTQGNQQVQYFRSDDKGITWNSFPPLSDARFDSRHVSAAIDPEDGLHISWRQIDLSIGSSQIMYRKLNGGKWEDVIPVSSSMQYQFFPSISAEKNGEVVVSWMETGQVSEIPREDPKNGKIYAATSFDGKIFSTKKEVSSGENNLYANFPEMQNEKKLKALVYETKSNSDRYDVIFKLFEF